MNYIDLFSGIGGFALGAYWAGMKFENHYFSEIDPYCVELYRKRFPDAIPLGDIKGVTIETLAYARRKHAWSRKRQQEGKKPFNGEPAQFLLESGRRGGETETRDSDWIITGGFPCQDISIAGRGEGITGSRSGLWFEMWRIIRDLRPRFAIMENVGAITFRGLDVVLGSLAEIGYDAEWQDIRAEDVGAPHRRERIWIVAYPNEQSKSECAEYAKPRQGELVPDPISPGLEIGQYESNRQNEIASTQRPCEEMANAASARRRPARGASKTVFQFGTQQRSTGCDSGFPDTSSIRQTQRRNERFQPPTENEG